MEAGTRGVIFPFTVLNIASAFDLPDANNIIFLADKIVLMPMVMAVFGTLSKLSKNLLLAFIVSSVSLTIWV